jgi:hypothetical protein
VFSKIIFFFSSTLCFVIYMIFLFLSRLTAYALLFQFFFLQFCLEYNKKKMNFKIFLNFSAIKYASLEDTFWWWNQYLSILFDNNSITKDSYNRWRNRSSFDIPLSHFYARLPSLHHEILSTTTTMMTTTNSTIINEDCIKNDNMIEWWYFCISSY